MTYCRCEQPIMDVEHDAGCRRCGLPVDFTPPTPVGDNQEAPIVITRTHDGAEAWLRNHYAETRTAEQQPLRIERIPRYVWDIPAGFMFGVTHHHGGHAVVRVGPRGGLETILSVSEYQWNYLKEMWS